MFHSKALTFELPDYAATPTPTTTRRDRGSSYTCGYFEYAIHGPQDLGHNHSLAKKIRQYIGERLEPLEFNVLGYWKSQEEVFSGLDRMPKAVLAIPATSCPSEGCLTREKISWPPQHPLLSSLSVEFLLCLKDWYCALGPMYVANPDPLVVSSE